MSHVSEIMDSSSRPPAMSLPILTSADLPTANTATRSDRERVAMPDRLEAERCSKYMKALSEADRLRIVECLETGPRTVTELSEMLDLKIAGVSHHLGILRNSGLAVTEKQGRFAVYSLNPDFYRSAGANHPTGVLDFGCCRLDIGKPS